MMGKSKRSNASNRLGFTLIELLIVLAIIGVLLALLLVAAQRVRESAARAQSMNNLRQISLAATNFAAAHDSRLPNIAGDPGSANPELSIFVALLPYVEQNNLYQVYTSRTGNYAVPVKLYISPADPTITSLKQRTWMASSYAANAQVFTGNPSFTATFFDGASNTILIAEHYSLCDSIIFAYPKEGANPGTHRATFADGGPNVERHANCGDDYPVTSGLPPLSRAAWGYGWTFQVAPNPNIERQTDPNAKPTPMPKGCASDLANTPHHSGMLTAFADGSVHILAGSISPNIYWGAVTPAGGEILGEDW